MPSPVLFDFEDQCYVNQWLAAYAVTMEAAKAGNEVFFRVRCVQEFTA